MEPHQDDDIQYVPIAMDRETRRNLVALARDLGEHPVKVAAALLRDVVKDDALAHAGILKTSLN